MAIAATTQWEVRTTGNNANGGGFDAAATGTDYSVQDAAQFTYTDLVIDAATNTKVTSAAFPFSAASPGNIINITGGTGFTVQRVQVVSVAGAVATCDKSLGTLGSTGGAGKLGGGLLTLPQAFTSLAATVTSQSGIIWVKTGTYTLTAVLDTSVAGGGFLVNGYGTTHGDMGTAPLITTATNSVKLIAVAGGGCYAFRNVAFSNTAATRSWGIHSTSGGVYPHILIDRCTLTGFTYFIVADNGVAGPGYVYVYDSVLQSGAASGGGISAWFDLEVSGCKITGIQGDGIFGNNGSYGPGLVTRTIVAGCTRGINMDRNATILNCTIANNAGDGLRVVPSGARTQMIANNILSGNGGFGVDFTVVNLFADTHNNAYRANTSGPRNNLAAGPGDITLTADPFVNAAGGDYSLNAVAGGGAACKGAGYSGVFPGGPSTGVLDVGAVQSACGAGQPQSFVVT